MVYDRPSWSEIDKRKDRGGAGRRREKQTKDVQEHSSRYDKYKSDLNRLFDQGMAGELLKKAPKEEAPEPVAPVAPKAKTKTAVATKKTNGRIPTDRKAATNRLKLIRAVIDAVERNELFQAVSELLAQFGIPDDLEVLVRLLEYKDESIVLQAVVKLKDLLSTTAKIPRRFTLRERLRFISQTAIDIELRKKAGELEGML